MSFLESIKENVLLADGATGTFLQSRGLEPGGCPELMNVENEDAVKEMADRYFKSGSDFVLTNTFGGSPFMLKKYGYSIAPLAMIMRDNPTCTLTGHRICNDCQKSCIFQKQDPVDTPQVESRVVMDVLSMRWGVEIYDLLMKWHPLRREESSPAQLNHRHVLVMGLGPSGFSMLHHLWMRGCAVTGMDGAHLAQALEGRKRARGLLVGLGQDRGGLGLDGRRRRLGRPARKALELPHGPVRGLQPLHGGELRPQLRKEEEQDGPHADDGGRGRCPFDERCPVAAPGAPRDAAAVDDYGYHAALPDRGSQLVGQVT